MLHSMTGYGEASHEDEQMRVGFRIRSVNNKGMDLNLKLPFDFMYMENDLRMLIKDRCHRGRVDIFTEIEIRDPDLRPPTPLNRARMAQLLDLASQLESEFGVTGQLDINALITLPELTVTQRVGYRLPQHLDDQIKQTFSKAIDRLLKSRSVEGEALEKDYLQRLDQIQETVAALEEVAKTRQDELREVVLQRVQSLMTENQVDELRLGQEVVYYADRLDISEEITRLHTHLARNRDLLASGKRPLGKQLDFLLQEQMREVTTIGNKAKHEAIAQKVVLLKTSYEKIREQVQNVE